jgi:microcystin-dependent protein
LLPINQNQALFSLLGTTYGGNGQTTFALPDLRSRVPIHEGNGHTLGERGGEENHTVTISELPAHTHLVNANTNAANTTKPVGNNWATTNDAIYGPLNHLVAMNPATITATGGSQPHNNLQPYLTINFCIALQGIFPSQN